MKRWSLLEWFFFLAFLFWSGAGLIFTARHLTADDVARWPISPGLVAFVQGCLAHGDPILILLAFANTHLHAARQWTPALARRWALIIVVLSLGIETFGAKTGLPFGTYHYTDRFGPMLGVVPLAIPLAWQVVVTNALFLSRLLVSEASRVTEALLTGFFCAVYDVILEPFATGSRQYWVWQGGEIPLLNYVAWFILSSLLVYFFVPGLSTRFRHDPRPFLILGTTLLIFWVGR